MSFREWEKYRISELYDISSGLSKSREEFGFGNPFVTFKDVFYNYFLPEKLESLANTNEKEIRSCSVKKGDLFLTRTSETQEELGMSCVALKDYENATFNGFTKRLRMKEQFKDRIDPTYIGYYMRGPKVRNQINGFSIMTTRASLNNSMINLLEIEIPPIGEQKLIGVILKSIDDKILINNQINKTLEKMAQAIFKQWFVDFEFPNEDGEPYQSSGGEMVESELGLVPKGWEVGTLNDLGVIVGGGTPSKKRDDYFTNDGIPWITPKDLSNNKNRYFSKGALDITELGLKNSSAKLMPEGTVLFSSRAPIGYITIAKNEITTNQGFKSIIPKKEIGSEFVYQTLKMNTEVIQNRATGSTFKEISGGELKKIQIVVPDVWLISGFIKLVDPIGGMIMEREDEIEKLKSLREMLLPKLMCGEIRVSSNGGFSNI